MIGTKVKIKDLNDFEWACQSRNGAHGEIVQRNERDNSYKIKFTDGYDTWFKFEEFDVVKSELDSVDSAVNYLISKGYKVSLTKKGEYATD